MNVLGVVFVLLFVSFCLIVFVGAPYVPSKKADLEKLFKNLKLPKGSVVIDLGSGDGKVLIEASKLGLSAVGYELNPFLFMISKFRLRKSPNAKVLWRSYWSADLSKASLVFVFTAESYMSRLQKKLKKEMKKGGLAALYGFSFNDIKIYKKIEPINVYKF